MPTATGPGWLRRVTWPKVLAATLVLQAVIVMVVVTTEMSAHDGMKRG